MPRSSDALGRMVEQNRSGTYTQIVYDPTGAKLALMSGQALQKGFVSLSGGSTAVYNSSGLAYYRHSDWLGSSRLASTPSRGVYSDAAYAPYGEAYASSGTADPSFTGMNQDTVSNLYDFPAREYNDIHGRWPSPDPAGLGAVDLTDPQTFNRYAYVRNSPLHMVDPSGLDPCDDDDPCLDNSDPCPIAICGDFLWDPFFSPGCTGCVPPSGFTGPTGPPIALPGQQLPGATPSTFPAAPGVDWTDVLFGPPNQSLLIFNNWYPYLPTLLCGNTQSNGSEGNSSSSCPLLSIVLGQPNGGGPSGGPTGTQRGKPECNPVTGICVPAQQGTGLVGQAGSAVKWYLCGSSAGGNIRNWALEGSVQGGWIEGGAGAVISLGAGVAGGTAASMVCDTAGVYGRPVEIDLGAIP